MNKIVYSLFTLCLICFSGCTDNHVIPDEETDKDGDVLVRFTAYIPDFRTITTRANGGVADMHLLVFNENGSFIVRRQAVLSNQTETGGTFTVQLPASSQKRTIHFVANYDWSGFNDAAMLGVNEAGVITSLTTSSPTFWSRVILSSGISGTALDGQPVLLLRNQAKISVVNEASELTFGGFTIHNTPERGTIAPYSATLPFTASVITEPNGVSLHSATEIEISADEKYLFERRNKSASEITTAIIKGIYEGKSYFYKIDLIDANKNRYDIQRNYHYIIKIRTVTRVGYENFEDALNGASHNNTALDPIIERYPMISDGTAKLEVEKTLIVLTQPGRQLQVWAKFFPSISSEEFNNNGVSVTLQDGNEALEPNIHFDSATGIITATALGGDLPNEPKDARIVVSKGNLARTIRVVLREPFRFAPVTLNNQTPSVLTGIQSSDAILRFNIPSDFPDDLFPLSVKIHTQGLYAASTGLEMQVEGGEINYIYRATAKGVQTVPFKLNKSDNKETVRLTADYFIDGSVDYETDRITSLTGEITYRGTPVPSDATVTTSTGSITVNPEGEYTYTLPETYTPTTEVSFTYERQVGSGNSEHTEEYSYTTTIEELIINQRIEMPLHNYIFSNSIQYGYQWGGWNGENIPRNANVTVNYEPNGFRMTRNGNFEYIVSGETPDSQVITFTYYVRGYATYTERKTLADLKDDSRLRLETTW